MWSDQVVADIVAAFEPLADGQRAASMRAYMKDVTPFLGLSAAVRRAAQAKVWRALPEPTQAQLCAAAAGLRELAAREYHYAAAEMWGRWESLLAAERLDADVRVALLHVPWWDTVDLLGTQVITPMVRRHPHLVSVMWDWNSSADQWLVRASIQHQRGLRQDTDIDRLLAMCTPHVADRRFFVAKAIGWALRDTCALDPVAVRQFVQTHPELPAGHRREADRGLARAAPSSTAP